jgi:hypothetical protein
MNIVHPLGGRISIVRAQRWVTQVEILLVLMKKRFQVGRDSRKGGKKKSMKEKTTKSLLHKTLTIDSTLSQMKLA